MIFRKRIKFIVKHIIKIGLIQSVSYFLQRLTFKRGNLIKLKIKGLYHPVYLRNKTYDINIFYQIFIEEELEYNNYSDCVNTIIDLGGNIGLSTLYFLRNFPGAQIISIEPASNNFDILVKNTEFYKNVSRLHAAVYKNDCIRYLVDIGEGEASYRILDEADTYQIIDEIPCFSLNSIKEIFQIKYIDILKMDIEGSEEDCLINTNTDWLNITNIFFVEIHESLKPGITKRILSSIPSSFSISKNGEYFVFRNTIAQIPSV